MAMSFFDKDDDVKLRNNSQDALHEKSQSENRVGEKEGMTVLVEKIIYV